MQILSSRSGVGSAEASASTSTPSRFRKSGFAAALGATAVLASAPLQTANAGIIYSGEVNQVVNQGSTGTVGANVSFGPLFTFTNTTTGSGSKAQASLFVTPNVTSTAPSQFAILYNDKVGASYRTNSNDELTANYGAGVSIGAGQRFSTNFVTIQGAQPSPVYVDNTASFFNSLNTPTSFYIGFRTFPGATFDSLRYGWAQFSVGADHTPFTLVDFAYQDTPGVAILTGDKGITAVPEPSSLAIVAALALFGGLQLLRRRRATTRSA